MAEKLRSNQTAHHHLGVMHRRKCKPMQILQKQNELCTPPPRVQQTILSLKKYGLNGSIHWAHRSVRTTVL